jgi:hypothetical protein
MTVDMIIDTLSEFISFKNGEGLLSILLLFIVFFFIITLSLFLYAVFQRIKNKLLDKQEEHLRKNWDQVILLVMHDHIHPFDGYKKLKKKHSISYLFYLEEYIDLLKGKEKERLLTLGRLSLKKVYRYLHSKNHQKIIYGIHLIGIFHPEEQYKFLLLNTNDMNITLTAIREMHAADEVHIKEHLIRLLFRLPNISYIYISNLLVEMGSDIVPFLKQVIESKFDAPNEQLIAIETVRRLHNMDCLDLSEKVLSQSKDPGVLSSWLRYLEDQKDMNQFFLIYPFIDHPNPHVRTAAIRVYLTLSDKLSADDIEQIFNDSDIIVPINAAEIICRKKNFPYISTGAIEDLKWKDIYKEILL